MAEDDNWVPEEDDWTPPTDAELKVLAAKRERSDKISKIMGDYMLKGYKMLATTCPICTTIELQDRQGSKYCVACQEVDCHETSKDDPALSETAASRGLAEEAFTSAQQGNVSGDRSRGVDRGGSESSGDSNRQGTPLLSRVVPAPSLATSTSPVLRQQPEGGVLSLGVGADLRSLGTSDLRAVTGNPAQGMPSGNPDLIPRDRESSGSRAGEEVGGAVARQPRRQQLDTRPVQSISVPPTVTRRQLRDEPAMSSYQVVVSSSLGQVLEKMSWAASQLSASSNLGKDIELVTLIRECGLTAEILHRQIGTEM